jgi:hypothetical protein
MTSAETLLADLECVIQELSDRVAALTQAVDALMDEIQWHNNHLRDGGEMPEPFILKSMPLDPCTDDWQINCVERDGRPQQRPAEPRSAGKGTLFE